jgi:Sulfatase
MRLGLLAALALVMCGCSLGGEGRAEPAQQPASGHPPVIVVVFDEFPADDLLGPNGKIDAARFPNFARLASMSTWFPNGHTIYDSTFKAVPAMLDGRLPASGTAPDIRSHKPNVFHLMDRLGYEVFKVESASAVCPPDICPGARTRRPGVLKRLAGSGRPARWHGWVGAIRDRDRPAFYFHHALMPHEPWIYLPSGRRSRPTGNDPVPGINQLPGFDDPGLSVHNHLRHLLQVGYTDRQIGELLGRLSRTGLLRRSLLIVTADHGYSYRVGVKSRRLVNDRNVEEIAPVPFFIKAPGQRRGAVNRGFVRNVDIVATIADLLGTELFWRQDGVSAYSEATRARQGISLPTRDFRQIVRISAAELEARRRRWRERWARLFGTGVESRLLYGDPWARAYRIGPNRRLLDRRIATLRVGGPNGVRARVANASLVRDVQPGGDLFPTRVTGPIDGVGGGEHVDLALAVNGRIRAVGRSFDLWRKRREYFSFMVPETSLRIGRNRLQVFEVLPDRTLVPLGQV